MTTDWQEVVNDPEIHIIIELVGGTGIAKTMILAALERGKTVVTANKALLSARRGLFAATPRSRRESFTTVTQHSHHQSLLPKVS